MKKIYVVSSAGQTLKVEGKDPFDACVNAVKSKHFKSLGWIFSVKRAGEDDNYCSTERVCKAANMWCES